MSTNHFKPAFVSNFLVKPPVPFESGSKPLQSGDIR